MADIKTEFLIEQVNKLKNKKFEIAILSPIIFDKELAIVQPYTQFPVQNYFIDLYYPYLKFAIEIDESHHDRNKYEDNERQKIIEDIEKCEFYRLKTDEINDVYETIDNLKNKILSKVNELKSNSIFEPWIPKEFKMDQVQKDYPNAIFYKTNMVASTNEHNPLRGPLRISQEYRKEADLFVTLSGDTIVSVYEINLNSWKQFPESSRGFYQSGNEIPNHPLISSGTTAWHSKTNKMYGENLEKKIKKA